MNYAYLSSVQYVRILIEIFMQEKKRVLEKQSNSSDETHAQICASLGIIWMRKNLLWCIGYFLQLLVWNASLLSMHLFRDNDISWTNQFLLPVALSSC